VSSSGVTSIFSFTTGADVLLIVSNLAFLVPAVTAVYLYRRVKQDLIFLVAAAIYVCVLLASATYHSCNSFSATCLFDAATHKGIDFFFAQLVIPLSTVLLIYFPGAWNSIPWWFMVFMAGLLFVLEITVGEGFIVQMSLALACFVVLTVYWIGHAAYTKRSTGRAAMPLYNWSDFVMAIMLTFVAISLFSTQMQWHSGYWAIHSDWHVIGALGQYFLLTTKIAPPPPPPALAATKKTMEEGGVKTMVGWFTGEGVMIEDGFIADPRIRHTTPNSYY